MWQAEADTELTLSASPATAVGQLTLTLANWRYSTVLQLVNFSFPLVFRTFLGRFGRESVTEKNR